MYVLGLKSYAELANTSAVVPPPTPPPPTPTPTPPTTPTVPTVEAGHSTTPGAEGGPPMKASNAPRQLASAVLLLAVAAAFVV